MSSLNVLTNLSMIPNLLPFEICSSFATLVSNLILLSSQNFLIAALENSLSPVKPLICPTSFLNSSKVFYWDFLPEVSVIFIVYQRYIIIKKGTEQTHEVLTRHIPDISIRTAYTCKIPCIYHVYTIDIPAWFWYTCYIQCIFHVYTLYIILGKYHVYTMYIHCIIDTEYVVNIHSI